MKSTWVGILASIFINPNPQWNYDALPRPVGPYKWQSQFFELLSFLVYLRCTLNDIDSQAQVEHHSITGDWKGAFFFGGGNKSSEDTCMLISVYGHVFIDYKKTESFIAAKSFPLAPATIWTTQQGHRPGSSPALITPWQQLGSTVNHRTPVKEKWWSQSDHLTLREWGWGSSLSRSRFSSFFRCDHLAFWSFYRCNRLNDLYIFIVTSL